MNILLANMPIQFNSKENLEPPLGISCLASVLEQAGEKVYLKDFEIEKFLTDELESFIIGKEIDLIGLSFRTASYRSAKQLILAVKKMKRTPLLLAGGHHASAFPEHTLKDLNCDIAVRGEAEEIILQLVKALKNKQPLYGVKGISFRNDGKIVTTSNAPAIDNLDGLPYPARHLLPMERYNVITILTSRGCPFNCIYCDKGVSTCQVKFRSPENVYREILDINRKFPKKKIYIVDDLFFLNKLRVNSLLDMIIHNADLKINWICQARVDGIDEELLRKVKKSGCSQIMYGVETGDTEELLYIKKQTTIEQVEQAVRLTKKTGITARTNFMLGFPISTRKSIENSIRFAKKISPDIVRFFSVSPLPNTKLWDYIYGEKADLENFSWDEFDFYNPNFTPRHLTKDTITSYAIFGYFYILGKRMLSEIVVGLIPNLLRLSLAAFRTGRFRGNISVCFPATVNLSLDTWHLLKNKKFSKKLKYLGQAISIRHKIK